MSFLRRHMKLIVLAGLIVGVLLISQVSSGASSTSMMEAGGCPELKSMKPEDFKPEMVVGRFYVENRDDPAAQTLLAESKKILYHDELPEKSRVIPEGMFVTMDFVADRFNIRIRKDSHEIFKAYYG